MKCIALLLAIGLLCGAVGTRADEIYDVHVILPLTGQAAFIGQGEKVSIELAEKAINDGGTIGGQPLRFIVADDESNPQVAVQLATDVMATKPAVILGPSLAATCRAIAPLLHDGPVMYCLSPLLSPTQKSYAFAIGNSAAELNVAQFRFFRLNGWKRLAFLITSDASGQVNEAAIRETLALSENTGMSAVDIEHFAIGDVSVAAQIANIKASHPDAMFVLATGAPVGTAFRAMVQGGLDIPVATGNGSMTYSAMEQYASVLPKQLYFTAEEWVVRDPALVMPGVAEKINQFYHYFEAAGLKPDVSSAQAWDAAMLVGKALQELGPGAMPTQVRDHLERLEGVPGVYGLYDFVHKDPNRGLDVSDTIVARWDAKAGTWLPVSRAGGFPLP